MQFAYSHHVRSQFEDPVRVPSYVLFPYLRRFDWRTLVQLHLFPTPTNSLKLSFFAFYSKKHNTFQNRLVATTNSPRWLLFLKLRISSKCQLISKLWTMNKFQSAFSASTFMMTMPKDQYHELNNQVNLRLCNNFLRFLKGTEVQWTLRRLESIKR